MTEPKAPEPGYDRHMLEALVCPLTQGRLRFDAERQELISEAAGLAYPIRDGIPVLLIEEALMPDGIASLDEFKAKFKDQIPR